MNHTMPSVKLSKTIVSQAKIISKILNRSVGEQIEHWATIGKIAEENPDLTYQFIKDILIAQQEAHASKLLPYALPKKKLNKRIKRKLQQSILSIVLS
jgi:hypothetical protein